jgi:hypothetical protein
MLCPECHGSAWLPSIDSRGPRPCEECGQTGEVSRCACECGQPKSILHEPDEWWDLGGEG